MKVYNLQDIESEEEQEFSLPDLSKGEGTDLTKLDREQKFTEPPPRFSEAMLVRELEKNGVGRPSTYASIVKTIQVRKYVEKEKGKMVPTVLGFKVNDYLVQVMPRLFDVSFTAKMEDQLDDIEKGTIPWQDMMEAFYGKFTDWFTNAKQDGPGDDVALKLIDAIPIDEVNWNPPQKIRNRTYDDRKYVSSLREQIEEGKKPVSGRQWEALLKLVCRYRDQISGLDSLFADHADASSQLQDAMDELKKQLAEKPAETTLDLLSAMLEGVSEWEEPVTRGKRVYDDKNFIESLKEQTDSGRKLSSAQLNALKRIVVKYRKQLDNYDELKEKVDLPAEPSEAAVSKDRIDAVFAMADEIKEFDEPTKRGRRTYDDKEFLESLRGQHQQGRIFSERQWAALQRVIGKYAKQITDFENRAKSLGLATKGNGGAKTDVVCPKCGKGKMNEKKWRGRTFFGCSKYPDCDYSARNLDDIAKDKPA